MSVRKLYKTFVSGIVGIFQKGLFLTFGDTVLKGWQCICFPSGVDDVTNLIYLPTKKSSRV